MAAQGLRHTDSGAETIIDREELKAVQAAGKWVIARGAIASAFFTFAMIFGA